MKVLLFVALVLTLQACSHSSAPQGSRDVAAEKKSPQIVGTMTCPGLSFQFAYIKEGLSSTMSSGVVTPGKDVTCKDVEIVANVFSEITDIAKKANFTFKDKMGLSFFAEYNNANYAYVEFNLPAVFKDRYAKNPVFTKPIWAHEFGHYLFETHIVKNNPLLWVKNEMSSMYFRLVNERAAIYEEFFVKYNYDFDFSQSGTLFGGGNYETIISNLTGDRANDFKQNFLPRLEAIDSRAEGLTDSGLNSQETQQLEETRDLASAYSELFADFTAVLWSGDGKAIYTPLNMLGAKLPKTQMTYLKGRDFTERQNSLEDFRPGYMDFYNVLSPVRYHVWKYYINTPYGRTNKPKLMRIFFETIDKEMSFWSKWNDRKKMTEIVNLASSNQNEREVAKIVSKHFIVELDKSFRANGITY